MSTPDASSNASSSCISILKECLPPIFRGKDLDQLTGKILHWRTIQNVRSQRKIPENCFVKLSPRKVVVLRDPFLEWLSDNIDLHIFN